MSTSYHSQRDRSLRGFFSAQVMNVNPLAFEMSNFSQKSTDMSRSVRIHAIKMRWAFLGPTYCLLRSYLYLYTYGVIFFLMHQVCIIHDISFGAKQDSCIVQSTYIHMSLFSLGFFSPRIYWIFFVSNTKKIKRTVPFPSGGKV